MDTQQRKILTKNWMCALSKVIDESITCRGQLIRIVSVMTTDRVAVGHSCSSLVANRASIEIDEAYGDIGECSGTSCDQPIA
jgi:hypothetical protein